MSSQIYDTPEELLKKTKPCAFFQLDILNNEATIKEMLRVAYDHGNIAGITANCVGVSKRIAAVKIENDRYIVMINPIIYCKTGGIKSLEEESAFLPGTVKVRRYNKVKVRFQQIRGRWEDLTLTGFGAQVVQHVVDRLDGKPFTNKRKKR